MTVTLKHTRQVVMDIEGNTYLRFVGVPVGKALLIRGDRIYKVLKDSGRPSVVSAKGLAEAVWVGPRVHGRTYRSVSGQ